MAMITKLKDQFESEKLDEVTDELETALSCIHVAMAELMHRQTEAQLKATDAQREAAEAAKATATFTQHSARYILWPVYAIAPSRILTA
jgi:hypothetical protein